MNVRFLIDENFSLSLERLRLMWMDAGGRPSFLNLLAERPILFYLYSLRLFEWLNLQPTPISYLILLSTFFLFSLSYDMIISQIWFNVNRFFSIFLFYFENRERPTDRPLPVSHFSDSGNLLTYRFSIQNQF